MPSNAPTHTLDVRPLSEDLRQTRRIASQMGAAGAPVLHGLTEAHTERSQDRFEEALLALVVALALSLTCALAVLAIRKGRRR